VVGTPIGHGVVIVEDVKPENIRDIERDICKM
jgi:hypothetical protein